MRYSIEDGVFYINNFAGIYVTFEGHQQIFFLSSHLRKLLKLVYNLIIDLRIEFSVVL